LTNLSPRGHILSILPRERLKNSKEYEYLEKMKF